MNAADRIGTRAVRVRFALAAVFALTVCTTEGQATELMPWLGISRTVDGDGEATPSGGLALRGDLLPLLRAEVDAGYGSESILEDQLKLHRWPITGSLYFTPIPQLYAGAGLGWYHTTYSYSDALPFEDETEQEFGIHVGGGLRVPVGPSLAVDLGGRYVMMQEQESPLIPEKFDPSFWMTRLGLSFSL